MQSQVVDWVGAPKKESYEIMLTKRKAWLHSFQEYRHHLQCLRGYRWRNTIYNLQETITACETNDLFYMSQQETIINSAEWLKTKSKNLHYLQHRTCRD